MCFAVFINCISADILEDKSQLYLNGTLFGGEFKKVRTRDSLRRKFKFIRILPGQKYELNLMKPQIFILIRSSS